MTITQEMVSVLFEEETIEKVKKQFANNQEIVPVDSKEISFRLLKTKEGNINHEFLAKDNNGMYFKVIGYYDNFERDAHKFDVTILNEFENDFEELENNLNTQNLKVRYMDIEESGLIAAFSREIIQQVQLMYREKQIGVSEEVAKIIGPFPHLQAMQFDKYLTINGLQIELLFSMEGFPQFFLDDEHNVQGAFGAYFKDENGLSLNPSVQYKSNFDKFYRMGLFSAFKSL